MVSLSCDETAKVDDDTLSFIPLALDSLSCVLKSSKLFLVARAFPFKILGNALLEN